MFKKREYKIPRTHFGEAGKAWIKVEISEDGRMVFLRELCFGGDASLGLNDIVKALADNFEIVAGIDEAVLERVVSRALAGPSKKYSGRGEVVIAREAPAESGRDGEVHYRFLDLVTGQTLLPYPGLKAAFGRTELKAVLQDDLRVRAVTPGEELAVIVPPRKAKPGTDIYGNITTTVSDPKRAYMRAGLHVKLEEGRYTSEIYGYVCVLDGEILVIPPVWVSPDWMEAYFIHFPQVGPQLLPKGNWLGQILRFKQILNEIPGRAVKNLWRHLTDNHEEKRSILLIQGTKPVPGENAELVGSLFWKTNAGGMQQDGGVNLKGWKAMVGVKKGDLVAEVKPRTKGKPGINLKGEQVAALDGRMCNFKAGKNVEVVFEGEDPKAFYAKIEGNKYIDGSIIDVNPVYQIEGDIDEKTGNIDGVKDLEISGSVRSGFKIKASGNITIAGVVEEGAVVSAKGDVVVGEGITGSKTKVIAMGNVETRSVQESSIVARGNIVVNDYISNGTVRSGGKIIVQSSSSTGGRIVGGEVIATKGIEAENVGSHGEHTVIGIGPDLETKGQMNKVGRGIAFCETNILRIFRTLGIQSLDPKEVQVLLGKTPPWRKKPIVNLLMKLKELVSYKEKLMKNQENLQKKIDLALKDTEIKVNEIAHEDVEIRIGEITRAITQELERPVFFLTDDIEWRLQDRDQGSGVGGQGPGQGSPELGVRGQGSEEIEDLRLK